MKFNIKKVATVLGTTLMLGATVGMAAAASFTPSSFSSEGIALVVGQNAALSDMKAAIDLTANLAPSTSTTTTSTVTGGDATKIERPSQKFNLNQDASSVLSGASLSKDELPALLADGVFKGKDNKEYKYTQKLALSNKLNLTHFRNSDYQSDTPTLGMELDSGDLIATYSLDFTTSPANTTITDKEITMMGKKYFILEQTTATDKLVLLDAAATTTANEGEEVSITTGGKTYAITVTSVYSSNSVDTAKITVNGESTEALTKGNTYKLSDGSYIGVKEIIRGTREKDVSKVELSLGTGKIELKDGSNVKANDKTTVRELTSIVDFDASGNLVKLGFNWTIDKQTFLTPSTANLTLPLFENVKIAMAGINFPTQEQVKVEANSKETILLTVPIKDGEAKINLAYLNASNGTFLGLGKDVNNKFVVDADQAIAFNESGKDKMFVLSWNASSEAESYLLSATTAFDADDKDSVTIRNEVTGEDVCSDVIATRTCKVGNTVLTVTSVNATSVNRNVVLTADSTKTTFNTVYTKSGLKITLPTAAVILHNATYPIVFNEENEDGKLANGNSFTVNVKNSLIDSENKTDVTTGTGYDSLRIKESDDYEGYVPSKLATKVIVRDPSSSQGSATIYYSGSEVSADVYVAATGASITGSTGSTTTSGLMTVYDNEVSSASGKNLIVIGGSAVNSVASELLGGIGGGDAFTTATGAKAGEAIIKSFARGDKTALLVAGYNAADTTNAVTYLSNNAIDTTVGKALKVTSATSATAITA